MKKLSIYILILLLVACQTKPDRNSDHINISNLPPGKYVKDSGQKLISTPYGLVKIINTAAEDDSTLIIAVHGYKSEGYEWIYMLNEFSTYYSNIYFYRYNWENCPDVMGKKLADSIDSLLVDNDAITKTIIYGHSYGGLVVTYAAEHFDTAIPVNINTIAAPLVGYPRILDICDLQYDSQNKLYYNGWKSNVTHHQWRTQKEFDGAFKDLDFDPQNIEIYNSTITLLPDSIDGHRLGHNWSLNWVTDSILENE